jgi:hypothetical protein
MKRPLREWSLARFFLGGVVGGSGARGQGGAVTCMGSFTSALLLVVPAATAGSAHASSTQTLVAPDCQVEVAGGMRAMLAVACVERGPVASTEEIDAWLESPASLKTGEQSILHVGLVIKPPFAINAAYPHRLVLTGGGEYVNLVRTRGANLTVSGQQARLDIPIIPLREGTGRIAGQLSYGVCSERGSCRFGRVCLILDVTIR